MSDWVHCIGYIHKRLAMHLNPASSEHLSSPLVIVLANGLGIAPRLLY